VISVTGVSKDPDNKVNKMGRKKILPNQRESLVVAGVNLGREGESPKSLRFSDTCQFIG
jgi:hypothetical protein